MTASDLRVGTPTPVTHTRTLSASVSLVTGAELQAGADLPGGGRAAAPPLPHTFVDLFAGIGGFHLAFAAQGWPCAWASEWDPYAVATYRANHGMTPAGDITRIPAGDVPDHTILTAGFPCQPFSIAGVSKHNSLGQAHGFANVTQGTLFFDVARILAAKRPAAFLLENVKNLLGHNGGQTFAVIKRALTVELGYTLYTAVIDARTVVPQHRERLYLVGFREPATPFAFPTLPAMRPRLRDLLLPDALVDAKYTLTPSFWQYLQDYAAKHRAAGHGFGYGLADLDGVTRTLLARYYKDGSEILVPQSGDRPPRRLTPRECARLMGYPDSFQFPVSDTRAYRQLGNSVVIPVVTALAAQIVATLTGRLTTATDAAATMDATARQMTLF